MDIVERMQRDLDIGCSASIGDTKKAIAEIERLREALKKANENHEHFEREWYLRADEIERLRQLVNEMSSVAYVIDSQGVAHHSFTIVYKELE